MNRIGRIALTMLVSAGAGFAAAHTWTGRISSDIREGGMNMSHKCILNCINGGGKYVFIVEEKSYSIPNQSVNDLQKHAGEIVRLVGDLSADGNVITVAQIRAGKTTTK